MADSISSYLNLFISDHKLGNIIINLSTVYAARRKNNIHLFKEINLAEFSKDLEESLVQRKLCDEDTDSVQSILNKHAPVKTIKEQEREKYGTANKLRIFINLGKIQKGSGKAQVGTDLE